MAKMTVKGLEKYISDLSQIDNATDEEIGKAIFAGAAIVADAARSGIQSIPVGKNPVRGEITPEQKAGLLDGLGIASMQVSGSTLNVKIGMDGYNSKGQPNSMILRSVEAGTSWKNGKGRPANPVVRKAVSKTRNQAVQAMVKTFDENIAKKMGG